MDHAQDGELAKSEHGRGVEEVHPGKQVPESQPRLGSGSCFRFVISSGDDMLPVLGPVQSLQFPVGFSLLGKQKHLD